MAGSSRVPVKSLAKCRGQIALLAGIAYEASRYGPDHLQKSVAHLGHRAELREFWIEENV
jgi:hypothetical protein